MSDVKALLGPPFASLRATTCLIPSTDGETVESAMDDTPEAERLRGILHCVASTAALDHERWGFQVIVGSGDTTVSCHVHTTDF